MSAKPVGIDLGTYNSVVAYKDNNGELQIATSDYGATSQGMVFPSFVKFNALGAPEHFGEEARLEKTEPSKVVWGVKRLIGKGFEQVQDELSKFLYLIERDQHGVIIPQGRQRYTPTDISSIILGWIKRCVEDDFLNAQIGNPVDKTVITHPAYFDEIEKGETRQAAEKAGFTEVKLITEPEAAALSYGLTLDPEKKPYVMVIDWGAGTLDIAIHQFRIGKDGLPTMSKASAPHGNLHLGGIDMDDVIVKWVIENQELSELAAWREMLSRREHVNLESEETISLLRSVMRLNIEAQEAKIDLSNAESTTRYFTYRGKQLSFTITRKQLEQQIEPLLTQFRKHIVWTIKEANLTEKDIKAVLLVGGPMKIPFTRKVILDVFSSNNAVTDQLQKLEKYLESHEWKFPPNIDPMKCVAKGAALYAEQLWGDNRGGRNDGVIKKGLDITAFDYGILLGHVVGQILIKRNVALPAHGEAALGGRRPFASPQPVSLYKEEVNSDTFQYQYVKRGDYNFYPSLDSMGNTLFYVSLNIGENAEEEVLFKDMVTGSDMTLLGLQTLDGEVIPKPPSPEVKIIDGPSPDDEGTTPTPYPRPSQTSHSITEEMINSVRRKGQGHLMLANMKLKTTDISPKNAQIVKDACDKLEQVIAALPSKGGASFKKWQDVQNSCEELRNRLQITGLLTRQEEDELSIDEMI